MYKPTRFDQPVGPLHWDACRKCTQDAGGTRPPCPVTPWWQRDVLVWSGDTYCSLRENLLDNWYATTTIYEDRGLDLAWRSLQAGQSSRRYRIQLHSLPVWAVVLIVLALISIGLWGGRP